MEEKFRTRLNKAISSSGIASRRKADELIKLGVVAVNGKVILDLGYKVFSNDIITVNNKVIKKLEHRYFIFNKPKGCITTVKDQAGRKAVIDYFPVSLNYLKPVGRLDRDTEGLLLMTNDGDYINKVIHPNNEVEKIYMIWIDSDISSDESRNIVNKLLSGVVLDGKLVKADSAREIHYVGSKRKHRLYEAVIHEGLNRQLRRMFQQIGYPVLKLVRTGIGTISLGGLKQGEYKEISQGKAYAIFNSTKTKKYIQRNN